MRFIIELIKAYREGGVIRKRTDPRYIFKKKIEHTILFFKKNYKSIAGEIACGISFMLLMAIIFIL